MQEEPRDHAEQEFLTLIRQLHAESGPIPRTRLSVVGRGRGFDVARLLIGLKAAGLVEEYETRPGWFGWLIGRRRQMLLRPLTPAVVAEAPAPEADLPAAVTPEPAPEAAVVAFEPAPLTAETLAPVPAPEPVAEPVEAEPAHLAAPEPEPDPTPAPQPVAEAAPQAVAPPVQAPVQAPVQPAAQPPAQPREPQPRPRPVPVGYADDIGGVPMAFQPAQLSASLDPDLLEGLRDFLVTLGMELTFAGEALVADRMNRGAPAGDALMQLVLFAFAHMARFDMLSASPADPDELRDYTHAVVTELERLRDAGEISETRFDQDRREILILADSSADRAPLVEGLFMDPIGGMAPPALLPAELRGVEEFEEDDILS